MTPEETDAPKTPDAGEVRTPPQAPPAAARPPRRPLPSPLSVITVALGLFLVVLTLLAIQVRNGRDPSLGPGPAVPAASQPQGKTQSTGTAVKQATKIVSQTSPVAP